MSCLAASLILLMRRKAKPSEYSKALLLRQKGFCL